MSPRWRLGLDVTKIFDRDGLGVTTVELARRLVTTGATTTEAIDSWEPVLYGLPDRRDRARLARQFPGLVARARVAAATFPETGEVDLFHSLALGFPPRFDGPVLFTCPDLTYLTHGSLHTAANRIHCTVGTVEALLAGARFHAISRATAEALGELLAVPDERLSVVPLGVDDRFRPLADAGERVAERFRLEPGYVLAVGTLEPRKNLGRLLDAWAGLAPELRRRHPLVIVGGRGWKFERTAEHLAARPELASVRLLGSVETEILPALYGAARVFAFPSLVEGFGLPVLEAMACGTAVVTSDRSSLPEVAGEAAVLVDPERVESIREGLARLLEDDAERRRRAAVGREHAAGFGWDATVAALVDVYEGLVGDGQVR